MGALVGATSAASSRPSGAGRGPNPFLQPGKPLSALLSPAFFFATESVTTFASNCTTPKTDFNLGETICARVTGAPVFPFPQRRLYFINPGGFAAAAPTTITTDPQNVLFTLPSTATSTIGGITVDNRGQWTASLNSTSDGGARARAFFTVHDPAQQSADISVVKVLRSQSVESGGNAVYAVFVSNHGPDAAQSLVLTDNVPANMTFASLTQNSGPAFNCTNPAPGGTGTSTCTNASFASGASASFTLVYDVNSATPDGTEVSNTANVTSTTTDPRPDDRSSTATTTVRTPTCSVTPPADITTSNAPGQSGTIVTYSAPTTSGTCSAISCEPPSGSFFTVGDTYVTCHDVEFINVVNFKVTVNDTQTPVISCPSNITVTESAPGSGSANVTFPAPTVVDNDPNVQVTFNPPSGSSFTVGGSPHTVTATATDVSGNTASCTFTVTVTAVAPPNCSLSCPVNITEHVAVGVTQTAVNYPNATATGTCSAVSYDVPSGSFFQTGTTTTVTATATDDQSNTVSCSFTVTVTESADTTPPTITCPADITQAAAPGACSANVNPGTPTASDGSGNPAPTVAGVRSDGQPLNAPYPVGATVITWTATDAGGNSASCEQTITVTENTPPTVTAPANRTVFVGASCEAEVPNYVTGLVASDNCSSAANLVITQSPAAETTVGPGPHTITITVTDVSGNTTTVTTTLTGVDNTPPTITAPAAVTVNADPTSCAVSGVVLGTPTTTDNCTVTVTNNAPAAFPLGQTTVTWTVTDAGGNTATATQTVTVVDHTPPVITRNGTNPMTVECHTTFIDPGATATDACDSNVPVTASGTVNANVPGTYTITYTASDDSGNAATPVTRTVNVVDTTAPTITLNGQTISLWPPNHKYHTVNVSDLVSGASDSCDSGVNLSKVVIEKVSSDEAVNDDGDGNTVDDILIASNCKSVQLRAERSGSRNGRVYTITFKVTDASGKVGRATAKVTVPKSQGNGGAAVDDGPSYTVNGGCP
ncbi:MAG: HYR domain-containing protein [Pyrinomonadaceae bacterium]